jgi:hypothetical protein
MQGTKYTPNFLIPDKLYHDLDKRLKKTDIATLKKRLIHDLQIGLYPF